MIEKKFDLFIPDIHICLEHRSIKIYDNDHNIIYNDLACVAYLSIYNWYDDDKKIVAFGRDALQLYSKEPAKYEHDYLISDENILLKRVFVEMLHMVFKKLSTQYIINNVQVSIPSMLPVFDKYVIKNILKNIEGIKRVVFNEKAFCIAHKINKSYDSEDGMILVYIGVNNSWITTLQKDKIINSIYLLSDYLLTEDIFMKSDLEAYHKIYISGNLSKAISQLKNSQFTTVAGINQKDKTIKEIVFTREDFIKSMRLFADRLDFQLKSLMVLLPEKIKKSTKESGIYMHGTNLPDFALEYISNKIGIAIHQINLEDS